MIRKCNELTKNKIISVKENKRKFIINNNSCFYINKVIVDDCYMRDTLRCDYLFEISKDKKKVDILFYVELKGKDIAHGIEQLKTTIDFCKKTHTHIQKQCYIVASKFPSASTSSQKFKKEFKRKNNVQLFIDTNEKKVTI